MGGVSSAPRGLSLRHYTSSLGEEHGTVTERVLHWRHLDSRPGSTPDKQDCPFQNSVILSIKKIILPVRIIARIKSDNVRESVLETLQLGTYKCKALREQSPHLTKPLTPPQQVYEVVRPLVSLLDTQRDGLQNYEALLGLTNLSGRSDKLR